MRVLILTDEIFAIREQQMLARLEIGLADEGVRVVHAVPQRAAHLVESDVFSSVVTFPARGFAVTRAIRATDLIRRVESKSLASESSSIDIVHAFGGSMWSFAAELARQKECPLVLDVWRAGLIQRARAVRVSSAAPPPVFFVPDPGVERKLIQDAPGVQTRITPWGVHVPAVEQAILSEDQDPAILLIGGGHNRDAMLAALEGIAMAIGDRRVVIFANADVAQRVGLWAAAGRLGLRDRLSEIPELEGRRDLAMHADIVIQPESSGENRTLTLDAMAHGMIVLASADPALSYLVDRRTARLLDEPVAKDWAELLTETFEDRTAARLLGQSARQYVREHHRASSYIASVLDAYEWLQAEAIPFSIR